MNDHGRPVPFLDTRFSMHYKNSGSSKTEEKKLTTSMKALLGRRNPSSKNTTNMKQEFTYGQQNIKHLKYTVGKQLEPYELATYIYCKSRISLLLLHGFKIIAQGKNSSYDKHSNSIFDFI